jgi:SEC-C motif-containing protein
MRSRYCAYALPNGQYLMETTYPAKRYQHDEQDMQNWGAQNSWIRLEIVAQPAIDKVEFKAYYTDKNGHKQLHHELSTFKKQNGKWYYFSSKFIHI